MSVEHGTDPSRFAVSLLLT